MAILYDNFFKFHIYIHSNKWIRSKMKNCFTWNKVAILLPICMVNICIIYPKADPNWAYVNKWVYALWVCTDPRPWTEHLYYLLICERPHQVWLQYFKLRTNWRSGIVVHYQDVSFCQHGVDQYFPANKIPFALHEL